MKNLFILIFVLVSFSAIGQDTNVIEVERPEIPNMLMKILGSLGENMEQNIEMLEEAFTETDNPMVKYKVSQYLGYYLSEQGEYDKSVFLWNLMHKEGLVLPFTIENGARPGYLSKYLKKDEFQKFIAKNEALKKQEAEKCKAEYFVCLPKDYNPDRIYPTVIVLHGGTGDFYSTYMYWESQIIREKFIAVYPQGRQFEGSYSRRYGENGIEDIKHVYEQVVQKYSVDTNRVILAGQSAGGYLSIRLSYEAIPVKGLFLAFPVKPHDFDEGKAQLLYEKGIGVVMIRGEKDETFRERQIELATLLDSANVNFREKVYPELGHGFPEDFSEQLDIGLRVLK